MEEIFRDNVQWMDESVFLVGVQKERTARLNLVRVDKSGNETIINGICEFSGGGVIFKRPAAKGTDTKTFLDLTDSETLCLRVLPKNFDISQIEKIMADPFWQYVLDHFKAAYVQTS